MKKMIMTRLFVAFVFMFSSFVAFAQGDNPSQKMISNESEFQKQYQRNIKKSRINGVHIPKNLDEAFEELKALSDEKSIQKFKNAPEDIIARKLHFGLGRWISVNWNFEEGSRYEHYLKELGIYDFDDMMQFTIVSFHRHLNNKDQQIKERVKAYQEKMEKKLEEYRNRSEVISSEKRKIQASNE